MPEQKPMAAGHAIKVLAVAAAVSYGAWAAWSALFGVGSTDFTIKPEELYVEYSKNPAAAFAKFDRKTVEMSGPVRGVRMDGSTPVLYVGPMIVNIQCRLSRSEAGAAGALKAGDSVAVRGRVRSSGSNATLDPCELK